MSNAKTQRLTLFSFLQDRKSIPWIIMLIAGVLLIMIGNSSSSPKNIENGSERLAEYEKNIEEKIADLCSNVSGVSSVRVMVYFDSGFETVYAYNEESKTTSSGTNSEKKYITIGSGSDENMVCVLEKMPNICGVAVVCVGGGNPEISRELISIISSTYSVPKNKIYIAEGKR